MDAPSANDIRRAADLIFLLEPRLIPYLLNEYNATSDNFALAAVGLLAWEHTPTHPHVRGRQEPGTYLRLQRELIKRGGEEISRHGDGADYLFLLHKLLCAQDPARGAIFKAIYAERF